MHLIHDGARVLCFSPHPDDTEFGVGATLSKYRGRFTGRIVVFSDRGQTRNEQFNERDQCRAAVAVGLPVDAVAFVDQLGYAANRLKVRFFGTEENRDLIRHIISCAVQEFRPDVVFIPGLRETFQDHSALAEEAVRILRGDYAVFGYEVPKHNRYFQPNTFVKIGEDDIAAKVAALQCFSEFTTRYYFEPDAIRSLARTRALDAGHFGFVEAFELYRLCVT